MTVRILFDPCEFEAVHELKGVDRIATAMNRIVLVYTAISSQQEAPRCQLSSSLHQSIRSGI